MFHPSSMGASSSFSWRLPGENPNHQQEEPHLLFHFPSQFYDVVNNSDNDVSMNHHQIQVQNPVISGNLLDHTDRNPKNFGVLDGTKVDAQGGSNSSGARRRSLGVIPRRKAGKKDRHSKICTAQGIRDRRMRLSLQVARKFFDLQDMLGYDKASKTIEWLFAKSKKAIKELTINNSNNNEQSLNVSSGDTKGDSFVSDCEVISEIEESSNKDAVKLEPTGDLKESNEKKRRTKDKKMIKDTSPTELGFSSFEQDPIFPNHVRNLPYGEDYTSLEQHPADCGTIEKLLGIPSSSFSAGSYMDPNVSFMGLLGWDIFTTHERGGSTSSNQVSPPGNSTPIYPSNH